MATFPALQPTSRTYTPGQHPSTPLEVLSGNEASIRHSNGSTGNILRLTFSPVSRANQFAVISHFSLHGRFQPFSLDAVTLTASNISIPTSYQWIYVSSPSIEETCSTISITVELELIPPFTI